MGSVYSTWVYKAAPQYWVSSKLNRWLQSMAQKALVTDRGIFYRKHGEGAWKEPLRVTVDRERGAAAPWLRRKPLLEAARPFKLI
jgi:hypothetical protein